jgi:hypothetical protein
MTLAYSVSGSVMTLENNMRRWRRGAGDGSVKPYRGGSVCGGSDPAAVQRSTWNSVDLDAAFR